jgi:hypothetical protein
MIGCASASCFCTIGSLASSGSAPRACATRSRTSEAAASGSRLSLKLTVTCEDSARDTDWMKSMPSMPDSASSIGLVICDSITCAFAPGYAVATVTTGTSTFGIRRTGRRW